jgi:hypothetical protein
LKGVAVDSSDLIFEPHAGLEYDDATELDGLIDDPTQHEVPETSLAEHMMRSVAPPPVPEERPPTRLERRSLVPPHDTKPMAPIPLARSPFGPDDDTTDREALEIDNADTVLPVLEIIAEKKRSRLLLASVLAFAAVAGTSVWLYLNGWIRL